VHVGMAPLWPATSPAKSDVREKYHVYHDGLLLSCLPRAAHNEVPLQRIFFVSLLFAHMCYRVAVAYVIDAAIKTCAS
jgi:hypothetical protein